MFAFPTAIALCLAFGWLWGSFLNALVDRTPRRDGGGQSVRWFSPARSHCLACGTAIPWHDNLPIVSYLLLHGRCRTCAAPIGLRTLAMEIVTPLAFAGLAMSSGAWPWPWRLWGAAVLSVTLLAVPTVLERRRAGRALVVALAVAAGGAALALGGGAPL